MPEGSSSILGGPVQLTAGDVILPPGKLKVFISYSRDDLDFADHIDVALDFAGFAPTLDRHGIHGAENWQDKLGALIRESDTVVFVLTPASTRSQICHWEVKQAVALGKRIIPVVAKPLGDATAPAELSALNYIFFYPDPKRPGSSVRSGSKELVKSLKTDLGWMQRHTRLLQRAFEWDAGGRRSHRLLSGGDITEAKAWLAARPMEAAAPTDLQAEYIRASEAEELRLTSERERELAERERLVKNAEVATNEREAALAREAGERAAREEAQQRAAAFAVREAEQARRVTRRTMMGLGASLLLALGAGAAGWYAWTQRQDAVIQAGNAKQQAVEAERQRREASYQKEEAERRKSESELLKEQAQKTESGLLANAASRLVDDKLIGDAGTAVLLTLEALPDNDAGVKRPYVLEAEQQLDRDKRALLERAVLTGHDASVQVAVFSPDGNLIVTASDDTTARVWDVATGREIARLMGHRGPVKSAVFSPDGNRIVTASDDTTARVWDTATGREVARLMGHRGSVRSAVFSPDGNRIVTVSNDTTARVWDAATGMETARSEGHTGIVMRAGFSPDGNRIVTASWDKTARIWDVTTGKELVVFLGHTDKVGSATFSPDGSHIVTASQDKTARVWEVATGKETVRLEGHTGWVQRAAFSPDGSRIITVSNDTTARAWDAATGKETAQLEGHDGTVWNAAFSPDGGRIVTASSDNTARVWDAATGKELVRLEGHDGAVYSAAYSPDGSHIVTASMDHSVRVWDASTREEAASLEGHDGAVYSAAYSPDGSHIVTASMDHSVRVWNASTHKETARLEGHDGAVYCAAFSADGRLIVTASSDKTARVWDAATGKELVRLEGHMGSVRSAAFSADGSRIATASEDRTTRIWEAATGKEVARLEGHTGWVQSAAFSRDGGYIVTASTDTTAQVWDIPAREVIARFKGHTDKVWSAAFSPDGSRIVTASRDKTARVWETATGKELVRLEGHGSAVVGAAYSPDGSRIVTASADKTARLWDAVTGKETSRLEGHDGTVWNAAFSPSGSYVITASKDNTARLWPVFLSTDMLVQATKNILRRCLTPDQRRKYFLPSAPPAWCITRRYWPYDPPSSLARARLQINAKDFAGAIREANLAIERAEEGAQGDWIRGRALIVRGQARYAAADRNSALADFNEAERFGSVEASVSLWNAVMAYSETIESESPADALLIALSHALGQASAARKALGELMLEASAQRLSFSISSIFASLSLAQGKQSSVTDCDKLAAHKYDPRRKVTGVEFEMIAEPEDVIAVCTAALESNPSEGRFWLQRARAHAKAAKIADGFGDADESKRRNLLRVDDLETAVGLGYPVAFSDLADAIARGVGGDRDQAKAAGLYLEGFNRVAQCCWAPVARHLLAEEDKHDKSQVLRVIREMTLWSAALGSDDSRELLTELTANGTIKAARILPPAKFTDRPPWMRIEP
jgi:WD40 repeat protein